ncbi:FkbM family methyltransferase [uncultured Sphingomonas sp.]|uniref:FkbM family methyltransferase n=1 Tax=uncultured Sphingomonas sp. TaxID=158754 RepID=UPI0035CC20B5
MDLSFFVGTRLGVIAQRARELRMLTSLALRSPEELGNFANNMMTDMLLERLCRSGATFIDVGAHVGSVIDGVRRHSRPGKIIAFEAVPAKAEALRSKFPDVEVHGCAVGDADGLLPFFVDVKNPGYSSLFQDGTRGGQFQEISVPVRRLDDLIDDKDVDLIKIDVEGAELGVLRGAGSLMKRSRPTISFESGPEELGGHSKSAMWAWLDAAEYAILIPNRLAHYDVGLSHDTFLDSHMYPRRTTHYFAVARERRAEIRARARAILKLDRDLETGSSV